MKKSIFLIAHPRQGTSDISFIDTFSCESRYEGELKETIDVFCINDDKFDFAYTFLQDALNEAKEADDKKLIEKFENALRVVPKDEYEQLYLCATDCPNALFRIVSDKTRMRCDNGWSLYFEDKPKER